MSVKHGVSVQFFCHRLQKVFQSGRTGSVISTGTGSIRHGAHYVVSHYPDL